MQKKGGVRAYVPLMTFGLLAAGLFISVRLVRYVACTAMAGASPRAECTFAIPALINFLPLVFLLIGVIGTAMNLMRARS